MTDLIERLRVREAHEKTIPSCGHNAADRERAELIVLLREAAAALEAAREDAARMDWLEQMARDGIRLHDCGFDGGQHVGLGLACTGRTLRAAIDAARKEVGCE